MADKKNKAKKKKEDKESGKSIRLGEDLNEFDIKINSFGQIVSNFDIDAINEYLNKHVDDKKLRDRKKESDKEQEDKIEE